MQQPLPPPTSKGDSVAQDKKLNPQERVWVFQYDGSKQCGEAPATPIAEMQKQLGDIPVYGSENKADGLMHIQMCGAPTGKANVYWIDRSRLSDALAKGFKEWIW